jgi:hypothetical protein
MRSVMFALALAAGLFVGDGGSMIVKPAHAQVGTKVVAEDACMTANDSKELLEAFMFHPTMGMMLFQEKLAKGDCIAFDTPEEVEVVKVLESIPIQDQLLLQIVEVRVMRTGQLLYGVLVIEDSKS